MLFIVLLFTLLSVFFLASISFGEFKSDRIEQATFGGGCFWCMEAPFSALEGVLKITVGYMGGSHENATYENVSSGETGHIEVVHIEYNTDKLSYEKILDIFWRNIDPTSIKMQFSDIGSQYQTVIFYHSENQMSLAEISKERLNLSGRFKTPVVTEIRKASEFYPAEEYHQKFYLKNPIHYSQYKMRSGRENYLKRIWNDWDTFRK